MITAKGLPIIQIGFFKDGRGCCQKYTHVELRFSDYAVTSITGDVGHVFILPGKRMSNPGYSCFFEVALMDGEHNRMRYYAENSIHIRFSYWNILFGSCCPRPTVTTCSSYICKLLQVGADMCMGLNAYRATPDTLFRALVAEKHRTRVSHNRYAMI